MKIAVDRDLLFLALSNAPAGALIDGMRLVSKGQDLEITWHMPGDPIAAGKIYLPADTCSHKRFVQHNDLSIGSSRITPLD